MFKEFMQIKHMHFSYDKRCPKSSLENQNN